MTGLVCAICGGRYGYARACDLVHPDHCCECHARNLAGGVDAREHPAPHAPVVRSPADVAAIVRYQAHVQRAVGTGPLAGLVTGEEAP